MLQVSEDYSLGSAFLGDQVSKTFSFLSKAYYSVSSHFGWEPKQIK